MKQKTKSKVFFILAIITIVIIGIVIANIMKPKILVNQTEKKISQIDASQLQEKIIEELRNTALNINKSSIKTDFQVCDINKKDYFCENIAFDSIFYAPSKNYFDNFVFATIIKDKQENFLYIPCFRITSDSNGKVRNIEYLCSDQYDIYTIIENSINKVLKDGYNINTPIWKVSDIKYGYNQSNRYTLMDWLQIDKKDYRYEIISLITQKDKNSIKEIEQKSNASRISIFGWNID